MIRNVESGFTNADVACLKDIMPCQPTRKSCTGLADQLCLKMRNDMALVESRMHNHLKGTGSSLTKNQPNLPFVTEKLWIANDHDMTDASAPNTKSMSRFDAIFSTPWNAKVDTLRPMERKKLWKSQPFPHDSSCMKRRKRSAKKGSQRCSNFFLTFLPTIDESTYEEDEKELTVLHS